MSTILQDIRILVVDDEEILCQLTAQTLGAYGAITFVANGAPDAIAILQKEKIDAVLSDLRMPKGDGLSLLARMQELDLKANFYLLTAFSDIRTRDLQAKGGKVVFFKPA